MHHAGLRPDLLDLEDFRMAPHAGLGGVLSLGGVGCGVPVLVLATGPVGPEIASATVDLDYLIKRLCQ